MHKLSQGYVQDMVLVPFNEPKMADTIFRSASVCTVKYWTQKQFR